MNIENIKKDYILAMLFGMILGDGWLSVSVRSYKDWTYEAYNIGISGDVQDLQCMIVDAKAKFGDIGKAKIHSKRSFSPQYGIDGTTNYFVMNTKMAKIFKKLGMPVGNRVQQNFLLPDWITKGDAAIKKGFISGLYAAEGDNLLFQKNDKTLKAPSFVLAKRLELATGFKEFCGQVSNILLDLGIQHSINYTKKHTCAENVFASFDIHNSIDNIFLFTSILDMRYCLRKQKRFTMVNEYYKKRIDEVNIAKEAYTYTLNHPEERVSDIAKKYGYTYTRVASWRKGKRNPGTGKSTMKF